MSPPLSSPTMIRDEPAFRIGESVLVVEALLLVASAWWVYRQVSPEIPLHYARPWGDLQLVPRPVLFLAAGLGVLSAAMHFALALILSRRDRLLSMVSLWSGAVIQFLLILAVLTVYLRVGPL